MEDPERHLVGAHRGVPGKMTRDTLFLLEHEFADRTIKLDLWFITKYTGTPRSLEGQNLRWVRLDELDTVGLLEADAPMVAPLRRRAGR